MTDSVTVPTTEPEKLAQPASLMRPHAEQEYALELEALAAQDTRPRPPSWKLVALGRRDVSVGWHSRRRNRHFTEVRRSTAVDGSGRRNSCHRPGATAVGGSRYGQDLGLRTPFGRNLGCVGRSWFKARRVRPRKLSATAGTTHVFSPRGRPPVALVPSPVMTAMETGKIARVEELTRIPADVQDALITILSEKTLPVPELGIEVQAAKGFNLIATANDRDRGVNDLSSALRRRFNTVVLPLPPARKTRWPSWHVESNSWAQHWNCRQPPQQPRKFAGSSPCSGNCDQARPPTAAPS